MYHTLNIDIETYSSADLTSTSVYKYVEAADFDILLIAYAIDNGEVQIIDTQRDDTSEILAYLNDNAYTKTAFNANFERVCLNKYFNTHFTPRRWECTAAQARYNGLPNSLENVAKALNLEEQKDAAGKKLITYFCLPCKPTKKNGMRTRNLPEHDPEKWELFKGYCLQDVRTERAIRNKIQPLPIKEKPLYVLDQEINDRGIDVDIEFAHAATEMCKNIKNDIDEELKAQTGIDNLNSVPQKKAWIEAQIGASVASVDKGAMFELIDKYEGTELADVLKRMTSSAMSSLSKYPAILECACADNRVRGTLMYYGGLTGRWAGKRPQLQNLPRMAARSIDTARNIVQANDVETLEMLYEGSEILSELIRTAFIAPTGKKLLVSDFSAIEARVIAWLAGEKWRLDVFNSHGKIYEASAAKMFNVPIEEVTKEQRGKGKIAELALGYQGSIGAMQKFGAGAIGLSESDMMATVAAWRKNSPKIVNLWYRIEETVKNALIGYTSVNIELDYVTLPVHASANFLNIGLPSGRSIYYFLPRLKEGKIHYKGKSEGDEKKGYITTQTYGGKLVENITQAIARDCLAEALLRLSAQEYEILFHVHDEVVLVAKEGTPEELERVNALISASPHWAPELPLAAAGYISEYYKKD